MEGRDIRTITGDAEYLGRAGSSPDCGTYILFDCISESRIPGSPTGVLKDLCESIIGVVIVL